MQSDMPEELCHFFLPLKAREEQEEERKFHVTFHFLAKFSCKSDDINKGEEMKTAKLCKDPRTTEIPAVVEGREIEDFSVPTF